MKSQFVFFAAVATATLCTEPECLLESKCGQCKPPRQQQVSSEERGQKVIASLLKAFGSFLAMITNPNDKQILVAGGMGIAESLAEIATEACKCVQLQALDADELLIYIEDQCFQAQVDSKVIAELTRTIKMYYAESDLLPQETRARYAEYAEHSDRLAD